MTFTYIGLVSGILCPILLYQDDRYEDKKSQPDPRTWYARISLLTIPLFTLIFLLLGIGVASIISFFEDVPQEKIVISTYIYSLEENRDPESKSKGSFILGNGTVHTDTGIELYYYAMVEKGNGLIMRRWPAEKVAIRKTNERHPAFRQYLTIPDKDKIKTTFSITGITGNNALTLWALYGCQDNGSYLDIPVGTTVTKEFAK